MAELNYDPFDCEAFPGAEFYLSGTRDHITLNAVETASERHTPMLSIARQGFLIRHPMPGDFTLVPPRDENRIPLEGAEGTPRRRPIEAPRAPAPIPRANPATHSIPFAHTQMRLSAEGQYLYLQIFGGGAWRTLGTFSAHNGRFYREYQDRHIIEFLRAQGLCVSRDGGMTIANPTRPQTRQVAPAEPDLDPTTPNLTIDPELPLADRVLAFRERLIDFGAFWEANAALTEEMQQTRIPNSGHVGLRLGADGWRNWLQNTTNRLNLLSEIFRAREANPHLAEWENVVYIWRDDSNSWSRRDAGDAPAYVARLPHIDEPERMARHDGWQRAVQWNRRTNEFQNMAFQPIMPIDQGGGEGGRLEPIQWGIDVAWREMRVAAVDRHGNAIPPAPIRIILDEFGAPLTEPEHSQGRLTEAMREDLEALLLEEIGQERLDTREDSDVEIVTYKVRRVEGTKMWCLYDEGDEEYSIGIARDLLCGIYAANYTLGAIRRAVLETRADGTEMLHTLTTALSQRINDLIAQAEREAEDEDYEPDYQEDDGEGF